VIVEIRGANLPGRRFCDYDNVHVGVQRKAEVVDLVPGDADSAVWELEVTVKNGPHVDFAGPYVHGKKGDRFLYLSWGTVGGDAGFEMFRRAKLMLAAIDPAVVSSAGKPGARLVCRLGLTGGDGGPRCAAVRPPHVHWSASGSA